MIRIERVGPNDWAGVRDIRLTALRDSPDWFWATHDELVGKPESWWREFVGAGAWFLACRGDHAVGIVAGIRDPGLGDTARHLISLWVEPAARGAGIATKLVDAVAAWARADGALELQLQVTENNHPAIRLYERCGFKPTGRTEPLPRKAALIEREMRLAL